jgi:hypothetical protein
MAAGENGGVNIENKAKNDQPGVAISNEMAKSAVTSVKRRRREAESLVNASSGGVIVHLWRLSINVKEVSGGEKQKATLQAKISGSF